MVTISAAAIMPFEELASLPEEELPDILDPAYIQTLNAPGKTEEREIFMDHLFAYNELPSPSQRIMDYIDSLPDKFVDRWQNFKDYATERVPSGNGGTVTRWTNWYFGVVGPLNLIVITSLAMAGGPGMIKPVTSDMVAVGVETLVDRLTERATSLNPFN